MYIKNNLTIEETIDIIKDHIHRSEGLSLTRFGDGEIFLLNRNSPKYHQIRKCRHWGYKYPQEVNKLYNDTNKSLIKALKESDIIGIMGKNNILNKKMTFKESAWSIKKQKLISYGINPETLKITDQMISRDIRFGKISNFKEILQGKSLNIISPHTEKLKSKNLSKILEANVTYTHHPFSINFKNKEEFIKNFKDIKSDVVLFGTGNIKDYGVELKEKYNKIAIDVGCLLDAWASIYSRDWFKKGNLQHYLIIKK
tara:strand:+ start:1714 stop:2481 length:768 start_codon:yes stop_codon:yes gene_type:complete